MDISFLHIFFFPLSPTKLLQDLTIRGAGWVSYTKQEQLILLNHLGWLPIFGGVHVAHLFSFLCCVLFVFVLCLVCPMLPVSLDCQFLIALSLFSNVYQHLPRNIQKRQIHIFLRLLFPFFSNYNYRLNKRSVRLVSISAIFREEMVYRVNDFWLQSEKYGELGRDKIYNMS